MRFFARYPPANRRCEPKFRRKILLLNNYMMDEAMVGDAPSNHLFGCGSLPPEWAFETPPLMAHTVLRRLPFGSRAVGAMWAAVGDPIQTLWVLRNSRKSDIVWATTQAIAPALGLLRRFRLLRTPLVVLVHNTASRRYTRFWLKGADAVVVFSSGIREKLIRQGVSADRIHVAPWGPDTAWKGYETDSQTSTLDFISTGKTYRDYTPLIEAAQLGKLNGAILQGSDLLQFRNGELFHIKDRPRLSNAEVIQALSTARVVVIPIADPPDPNGLTGITELADAVAIGKPVVMTENPLLPLDIQSEGIGVTVPASVDGKDLLSAIQRAKKIETSSVLRAREHWNEKCFSQEIVQIFDRLLR